MHFLIEEGEQLPLILIGVTSANQDWRAYSGNSVQISHSCIGIGYIKGIEIFVMNLTLHFEILFLMGVILLV